VSLPTDALFAYLMRRFDVASLPWPGRRGRFLWARASMTICSAHSAPCLGSWTSSYLLHGPRSQLFLPFADCAAKYAPAMISTCVGWANACVRNPENSDSAKPEWFHRVWGHLLCLGRLHIPWVDELRAASWVDAATLPAFYLKDLCQRQRRRDALGPLVVGQRVFRPWDVSRFSVLIFCPPIVSNSAMLYIR